MKAERKAALALYGLHNSDRRWILSQLDEGMRNRIYQELKQLQVLCRDKVLDFRSLLVLEPGNEREWIFNGVNAGQIDEILNTLPDSTLITVASCFEWMDKQDYLSRRSINNTAIEKRKPMKPKAIQALKDILQSRADVDESVIEGDA